MLADRTAAGTQTTRAVRPIGRALERPQEPKPPMPALGVALPALAGQLLVGFPGWRCAWRPRVVWKSGDSLGGGGGGPRGFAPTSRASGRGAPCPWIVPAAAPPRAPGSAPAAPAPTVPTPSPSNRLQRPLFTQGDGANTHRTVKRYGHEKRLQLKTASRVRIAPRVRYCPVELGRNSLLHGLWSVISPAPSSCGVHDPQATRKALSEKATTPLCARRPIRRSPWPCAPASSRRWCAPRSPRP